MGYKGASGTGSTGSKGSYSGVSGRGVSKGYSPSPGLRGSPITALRGTRVPYSGQQSAAGSYGKAMPYSTKALQATDKPYHPLTAGYTPLPSNRLAGLGGLEAGLDMPEARGGLLIQHQLSYQGADGTRLEMSSTIQMPGYQGTNGLPSLPLSEGMGGYFMPQTGYMNMDDEIKRDMERQESERLREEMRKLVEMSKHNHIVQPFDPHQFIEGTSRFVGTTKEVENHVAEAFQLLTGKPLPQDFTLQICTEEELQKAHQFFDGGQWSSGIQGFCINRRKGMKRIFVKGGELARVLLTIGHELGHIQSAPLPGMLEEAKAYAFSLAWMEVIKQHNIAGLQDVIVIERPAHNGLHDVAFAFVCKMMQQGKKAYDLFQTLLYGKDLETFLYPVAS